MKEINTIKNVYLIGIAGIGMSALARHFNQKGCAVSGYDKTSSPYSKELEQEGIAIHYEDSIDQLDKNAELVIYTPAVPKEHEELNYYRKNNYPVLKRSEVLELLTKESFNICIAGTHGKTTTSTMVAHILRDAGIGCTAFLGGVSVNYDTNYWSSENNIIVVEADEYDRSFLKLDPDIATISAMDEDHLDIYGTKEAVEEAFIDFSKKIKKGGVLISKSDLTRSNELVAGKKITYNLRDHEADVYADNIVIRNGSYNYSFVSNGEVIKDVTLNIGGLHNVENSIAAIQVALEAGAEVNAIKKAVSSFQGVRRRFEYKIKTADKVYIDDYAHHPEELRALLYSALELFPDKECTIIFQPHLYSRTRDLADQFAESLSMAHQIILLPIYPARELPIEGVSSRLIFDNVKNKKWLMSREEVLEWVRNNRDNEKQLYITAGAGDIDQLINPIKNILEFLS